MGYQGSDLDTRQTEELVNAFELAENIVFKDYINHLEEIEIVKPDEEFLNNVDSSEIRLFKVDKIIYDKDENNLQKLTNLYRMAYTQNINLCVLISSDGKEVSFYMGICQEKEDSMQRVKIESLYNGFIGNFPGSLNELTKVVLTKEETEELVKKCFDEKFFSVSVSSGVASLREEKMVQNNEFVQGIEKMIDTMRGIPFTTLIIANPIQKQELLSIKRELETLYSDLQPFEKTLMSFNASHAEGVSDAISKGFSDSVGTTKSTSLALGTTKSTSKTKGYTLGASANMGAGISKTLNLGLNIGIKLIRATAGIALEKTKTFNAGFGLTGSIQRSKTETEGSSETRTEAEGTTKQHTTSETSTSGTNKSDTTGSMLQLEYINKTVKQLLDRIDLQLKRLNDCENYGMFATAAYFASGNAGYSSMAASTYQSLISGEKTALETSRVSTWDEKEKVNRLKQYLRRMYHPVFLLKMGENENEVTPVSMVSGNELSIQMGLPKKSVSGLTVTECASFGRNIYLLSEQQQGAAISIGNIYHMCAEEKTEARLKLQDFTMHTFITGATGSGKSNTIYSLLEGMLRSEINFMVIEPAKGEYKEIFGGRRDVNVYGTNMKKAPLLQINPFSFPDDIHVLEHIDRLIEIFNACWPMYAAMPAVLKDSIERAYISTGWNLTTSECRKKRYPTFYDVERELETVISLSKYSNDTKGDYTGALQTRINSLTNGINGLILCSEKEISDEDLFDRKVIVDLSRVGSAETKSLLMGILVIKLQEHRMNQGGMNLLLKHVTVLEEAHHLLKRTSTETSQESSNLQGKSVEMIGNAIAEMRTYGEGFIIADQSPALMDMSVIRNTNTKIILRLPDEADRLLVGKAASLNNNQIEELAKLEKGVAAIYQNNWLEAILCKVPYFDKEWEYKYIPSSKSVITPQEKLIQKMLNGEPKHIELTEEDVDYLKNWIEKQNVGRAVKQTFLNVLHDDSVPEKEKGEAFYSLIRAKTMWDKYHNMGNEKMFQSMVDDEIIEKFNLTEESASQVRMMAFSFASNSVKREEQLKRDLLLYGGVK